jgi:hypothetical protein
VFDRKEKPFKRDQLINLLFNQDIIRYKLIHSMKLTDEDLKLNQVPDETTSEELMKNKYLLKDAPSTNIS